MKVCWFANNIHNDSFQIASLSVFCEMYAVVLLHVLLMRFSLESIYSNLPLLQNSPVYWLPFLQQFISFSLHIVKGKVTSFLSSLIASRIIPGENRAQPGSVRVLTLFVIWWLGSLDFCLHAWILLQREKLHMCVKMKQCGELFENTENRKTDRKETPRRTRSKNAN